MKIAVTSDLHSYIPEIPPDINLLLIAGDFCLTAKYNYTHQAAQFNETYIPWINRLEDRGTRVIFCAGNHCGVFQNYKYLVNLKDCKGSYLEDSGCKFKGLIIWASPRTPVFMNWFFNNTEKELKKYWDLIPDNTDILMTHGPPYGYGDLTVDKIHAGSYTLLERIKKLEKNQLRYLIYGHIHEQNGQINQIGNTTLINCSYVNEEYQPSCNPIVIEI